MRSTNAAFGITLIVPLASRSFSALFLNKTEGSCFLRLQTSLVLLYGIDVCDGSIFGDAVELVVSRKGIKNGI